MRIAVVIDSVGVRAGIERVVSSLADIWIDLGYHVVFVTKDDKKSVYKVNPKVAYASLGIDSSFSAKRIVRYYQKIVRIIISAGRLKTYFAGSKYDYIYSATPDNTLSLFLAGLTKSSRIIASEHGAYAAYNFFWKTVKKIIYPRVWAVVSITEKDSLQYKKINSNTYHMPNPLSFRSKEKSSLKNKRAVAAGRLVQDKGYDRMIAIWKRVVLEYPDWELCICGTGELKQSILDAIKKNKMEKNIRVMPFKKDIKELYLSASIYLMTSYCEGFGMVLIEAMECGVPCVAFDCPVGPGEIIHDGNGLLITNGDLDGFTSAVKKCIEDLKIRKNLALKAKESVKEYYSAAIAEKWRCLYEKQP